MILSTLALEKAEAYLDLESDFPTIVEITSKHETLNIEELLAELRDFAFNKGVKNGLHT